MMTAAETMVITVSEEITILPPARCRSSAGMDTTEVKFFGSEPQISSARFCNR